MKKFAIVSISIAIALFVSGVLAQSSKPAKGQDKPVKDQEWLKQLVGEWDIQFKMYMQPDQPPAEAAGTDSVRALGDHWIVAETTTTMMGAPYSGILSLGYDPQEKHFIGTWIDSFGGHLWVYKGTLNEDRNTLTLETKGPSLEGPDKTARYKEIIQITRNDSRTFTSSMETDEGTWMRILSAEYRRKTGNTRAHQERSAPDTQKAINVHYLEIVTPETDATCNALEKARSVTFGEPVAELGNARTAKLKDGGRIGVRAPMRETETPVVRPYVLVDDIQGAVNAAETAGAQVAVPPTEIPGHGTFAIFILGGIEHGLWQL